MADKSKIIIKLPVKKAETIVVLIVSNGVICDECAFTVASVLP